jgi:hypothetical protein
MYSAGCTATARVIHCVFLIQIAAHALSALNLTMLA